MKIDEVKHDAAVAIEKLKKITVLLDHLEAIDKPDGISFFINYWDNTLLFTFSDYKLLPVARKMAQTLLPGWDGKISTIWAPYEDHRCAAWEDKGSSIIELRLSCDAKNFPTNISGKEGCEWVKKTQTTESFVCNLG